MTYFGKMLRKIRLERGLRQADIAEALGVAKGTISMYESGQRTPSFETAEHIADILNVPLSSMIESPVPRSIAPSRYISPDFSSVERMTIDANLPGRNTEDARETMTVTVPTNSKPNCDFAITVTGPTMSGERFREGDVVFIRAQAEVEDGSIALVAIGREITLRRIYNTPAGIAMVADNPHYPPLVFSAEESDKYHILGKAVAFQASL